MFKYLPLFFLISLSFGFLHFTNTQMIIHETIRDSGGLQLSVGLFLLLPVLVFSLLSAIMSFGYPIKASISFQKEGEDRKKPNARKFISALLFFLLVFLALFLTTIVLDLVLNIPITQTFRDVFYDNPSLRGRVIPLFFNPLFSVVYYLFYLHLVIGILFFLFYGKKIEPLPSHLIGGDDPREFDEDEY